MGGPVAYRFAVQSPKRLKKLVIISSTYKTGRWLPTANTAFKDFKPKFFDNTPLQTAYYAVSGLKGEMHWIKVYEEIFDNIGKRISEGNTALYGRVTYQIMENYWHGAGDGPTADKHDIVCT